MIYYKIILNGTYYSFSFFVIVTAIDNIVNYA